MENLIKKIFEEIPDRTEKVKDYKCIELGEKVSIQTLLEITENKEEVTVYADTDDNGNPIISVSFPVERDPTEQEIRNRKSRDFSAILFKELRKEGYKFSEIAKYPKYRNTPNYSKYAFLGDFETIEKLINLNFEVTLTKYES